jgi:hypothetical protein
VNLWVGGDSVAKVREVLAMEERLSYHLKPIGKCILNLFQ